MEHNEGIWYMNGCAEDSPSRLFTAADLLREVKKTGFLPLFANEIPGFSVEERTATSSWWTGDPETDPWEWRILLSRDPDIAYGQQIPGTDILKPETVRLLHNPSKRGILIHRGINRQHASQRLQPIDQQQEI